MRPIPAFVNELYTTSIGGTVYPHGLEKLSFASQFPRIENSEKVRKPKPGFIQYLTYLEKYLTTNFWKIAYETWARVWFLIGTPWCGECLCKLRCVKDA